MSKLLDQVLLVTLYLQPIQFFLVIITNILNVRVLSSRVLRSSSCTHYFLAYAVFCIIYICLACPTQFLRGFYIDWANERIGCKMHFYFVFVAPVQAKVMLLLASFDRYCSSLQSFRFSTRSSIRTARCNILIGTILSAIFMSPMLIIYNWDKTSNKCIQKSNTLIHIYLVTQVSFYYVLAPILMIIFGTLTIFNIHQRSIRSKLLRMSRQRRRTEGQLARMLILQVAVHIIIVLPFGVTYGLNAFYLSTRTENILAIRYIFVMVQQCDYFLSFFLYIVSGRVYREELIRIFRCIRWRHIAQTQSIIYQHEYVICSKRINGVSV